MSFVGFGACFLLGVWVIETVLFVLSYRTNTREEGARTVKTLL